MALTARSIRDPAPLHWLVYADAPTSASVGAIAASVGDAIQTPTSSPAFRTCLDRLEGGGGAIVVLGVPPADRGDLAAAAALRRRRPGSRLLLVNEPDDAAGRLASLELGFDDALPSTVGPEELAARARILVARRGAPNGTRRRELAVTADAHLDPVARRVLRDGRDIHLRPRELSLLLVLCSHPGRAFSRGELLDRVWGTAFRGDPRTVDVHVRWLRSKLEPDPPRPIYFHTVRGLGYRFDPPGPMALIDS